MEETYYIQTSEPTMIIVQTAPPPPLKKKSHELPAATGWIGRRIGITSFCLLSQVNLCSEIYLLGTLFSSPRVQALHSLKDCYIWVTVGHFYRIVHKLECKLHVTLLNRWFIHAQPHHWWIQRESTGGLPPPSSLRDTTCQHFSHMIWPWYILRWAEKFEHLEISPRNEPDSARRCLGSVSANSTLSVWYCHRQCRLLI